MTYIYGIKQEGTGIIYIGSTDNYERRFKEHRRELKKGKHLNKTLQKYYNKNNDIEFKVLCKINTDNTLLKFFMESLYNSYYKPKTNKCVIMQGRNRVILQRCDKQIAKKLIDNVNILMNMKDIENMEELK